jgi:hypothetical protein
MDGTSKRRVGRPKTIPQSGPLVLEAGRARVTLDLEVAEATAEELREYARWVELSSAVGTQDALFRTVDFALRDLFRRDRLWQARRRQSDKREPPTGPQALPPPPPGTTPPPPSSPPPRPALPHLSSPPTHR